ncbi:F-box protein At3g07870 [Rhodamnia argentea]|uniref:F-box protein At3g07870 n=1 Tax=Rhodamnia argentea TaxID=178133 RepID=A0A8B8MP42_9MYRT|nr:F-box protein At3g07870 [Rhodamnia argentea]
MEFVHHPPCKKQRCELGADPRDETETGMEDLPREIVLDILSRLPVTSIVRFRLVCRSWRALGRDPLLPDAQLARTAARDPVLVLHSDFPLRNLLSFVELSARDQDCEHNRSKKTPVGKFNPPFLNSMPEFDVVGSCNGLLCLADLLYTETLFVYNPFTRDCRELPRSRQYADQTVVFGFGFHPETREYKVIKIAYYPNPSRAGAGARRARRVPHMQSEVQVLTLGGRRSPSPSPAWRSLGRAPYQIDKRPSETVVNGRLHWVAGPRRYRTARQLVSFDLADEQFREVPRPEGGTIGRSYYQLMELRGCLSAIVYCNYGRLEIWVMKRYDAKESWAREHVIGSYMPKALKQNPTNFMPFKMWKSKSRRVSRVVCGLDSGEILLEYKSRALAAYDPKRGKFRDIWLQGMPNWFRAFVHVGSLSWIDSHSET